MILQQLHQLQLLNHLLLMTIQQLHLFQILYLNLLILWINLLLFASLGFHCIDSIRQHFQDLYQDTITLDSTPAHAILDKGDLATLRKTDQNTITVPRPMAFGDVIHTWILSSTLKSGLVIYIMVFCLWIDTAI